MSNLRQVVRCARHISPGRYMVELPHNPGRFIAADIKEGIGGLLNVRPKEGPYRNHTLTMNPGFNILVEEKGSYHNDPPPTEL